MDQLRALRYFCKVVETGSFTKAAESFSVPASSLSRRIADLEKSLGANLLKRTTRVVQVTEIGRTYYEQVQDVLAQLASSDESVRAYQASPTGTLRISTMVTFGEEILMPLLDEFKHRYPEIILDVSFSDELSTLSSRRGRYRHPRGLCTQRAGSGGASHGQRIYPSGVARISGDERYS